MIAERDRQQAIAEDSTPEDCFVMFGDMRAGPFTREAIFGPEYLTTVDRPLVADFVPGRAITAEQYLNVVERVSIQSGEDENTG